MQRDEDLISSEEISALLPNEPARDKKRPIQPYNFRRPDRLSKEQVRGLYLLHDLFAHSLSSDLPLVMRAASAVELISVEQRSYSDYLKGLVDPTTLFTLSAPALRSSFVIELNSSIAFSIVDRLLGGDGKGLSQERPATDLELKLIEGFVASVLDVYQDAWSSTLEFKADVIGRETRPQLLQIVPPNEIVVTIVYQMQIGEAQGLMSICLPVTLLEPVLEKFARSSVNGQNASTPEATNALLTNLSAVRIALTADLDAVTSKVSDLLGLDVGDVIRTDHSAEKPVNVCIANEVRFPGRIASLDGKLVIQLTERPPVELAASH